MAPELLDRTKKYSPIGADVWALGVTLFYLCEGRYPFKGYDERDLFRNIKKGVYEIKRTTSPILISIIEKTLVVNPEQRMPARDLTQN